MENRTEFCSVWILLTHTLPEGSIVLGLDRDWSISFPRRYGDEPLITNCSTSIAPKENFQSQGKWEKKRGGKMEVVSRVQSAKCKMQKPKCKVQTTQCKVQSRQSDDKVDLWNIAFTLALAFVLVLVLVLFLIVVLVNAFVPVTLAIEKVSEGREEKSCPGPCPRPCLCPCPRPRPRPL